MNFVDSAEPARLHQFASPDDVRHAPLLHADLHDPRMLGERIEDDFIFRHVVRERLLDIDILAGRHGRHGDRDMPVIGRRDQDRVNVLVIEQTAIIAVDSRLGIGELARLVQVRLIDIAQGSHPRVGDFGQRPH